MKVAQRKTWFGTGLLVVALIVTGLSASVFLRAGATQERIDGHLRKAAGLLSEAETVKGTDPGRYEELTREADRYAGFADADQEEYGSQSSGAWLLAAGAAGCLAGCFIVLLPRRGRALRSSTIDRA
ncbi:hypothetical protein [Streptosporangium sp. NPDC003464]